jgi:hypothetical protein
VELLVHGELASLSEGFGAAFVWALEGLLACVDVGMLLQVLSKSKLLEADHTSELLSRLMGGDVSSE